MGLSVRGSTVCEVWLRVQLASHTPVANLDFAHVGAVQRRVRQTDMRVSVTVAAVVAAQSSVAKEDCSRYNHRPPSDESESKGKGFGHTTGTLETPQFIKVECPVPQSETSV